MIATSRKRGYSAETIIDTATVKATSAASRSGTSSHVHVGDTPEATTNTITTTTFSARLNTLVSTTASGMTSRGNCVFRTIDSWATIDPTALPVASENTPNTTMFASSSTG